MTLGEVDPPLAITQAAGAVVLRGQGKRREVALIHRPAYNDWSLPKGKAEKGEIAPVTAIREVEEETGIRIRLGAPVREIRYRVPSGAKVVHFWVGHALQSQHRRPDDEVDDVVWLRYDEALMRLTYADERGVLAQAASLPETTPFIIARHARATPRTKWSGDDRKRPLDSKGRKQARDLVHLFDAFGVQSCSSSSSVRCLQTVAPYARLHDLRVKPISLLSEEVGEEHVAGVERYVRKLAVKAATSGVPAVVCGHRPVLPAMIRALDIEERAMTPASALVVHLDDSGEIVAHEWYERPEKKKKKDLEAEPAA